MLHTRVVPRRERALIDTKYHVGAILANLNAVDQRTDQLPAPRPVEVFQAVVTFALNSSSRPMTSCKWMWLLSLSVLLLGLDLEGLEALFETADAGFGFSLVR